MRRIISFGVAMMLAVAAIAQSDVTIFLGIPVDGKKSAMIQKLKEKGFRVSNDESDLIGEFNGEQVNVYIQTNKDKVYRVMICDANTRDVAGIRTRFNILCQQFAQNERYFPPFFMDYTIPEDEDIAYEMTIHNKQYEALFYQKPSFDTNVSVEQRIEALGKKVVWFRICKFYSKYYIAMYYDNEFNKAQGEDL